MFVTYLNCRTHSEGDPAGFIIACDSIEWLCDLDYDMLERTECLWIVPGTIGGCNGR
jgi:hypothetical protein